MKDYAPSALPAQLVFLARALIERKEWQPEAVEAGLGWEAGRYREFVEGPGQVRLQECFKLLQFAMEAEPANQPSEAKNLTAEDAAAMALPAAFYARSPYRNHPSPVEMGEVRQMSDDATGSFVAVVGMMLRVAEALKAEGCLDAEPVKKMLYDYLQHLAEPIDEEDSG